MPRLGQRLLIHVGGIDLDALAECVPSQGLCQQDRHGIGLLPGGAAHAPDTDRLLGVLSSHDARNDLISQVFPGRRIAEKSGHVDQDRVEQVHKLFRAHLQMIQIVAPAFQAEELHPLMDPPHQARPLVSSEIEAAAALQVLQQGF